MKHDHYFDSLDLSSRHKRRETTKLAVKLVGMIHLAEYNYMERIPVNLKESDAYYAAEETIDYLLDAINALENAFG